MTGVQTCALPISERDLVELLQNGLMEAFADAIGLRMAHLRLRMLDVIQSQIELVIMRPTPLIVQT